MHKFLTKTLSPRRSRYWFERCVASWLLVVFLGHHLLAQVTVPSGSYIIQMNANTTVANKGLKPYGMVHELVKFYNVPVLWVVKEGKAKDDTDYVINGTAYSGSLFVISSEYLSSTVQAAINQWSAAANTTNGGNGYTRGFVTANQISSDYTFEGAKTMTIRSAPLWTLDDKNGKISEKIIKNAGIPPSAYNWLAPANLGACNDIFVMPHADPAWSSHGNLLTWNQVNKGSIWAGCHAISALENTYNPADISQQMNFLTNKVTVAGTGIILPEAGKTSYSQNSLVLWDKHKDGTPAYLTNAALPVAQTGRATPADDWVSQYLGASDLAHTNGSEQIYMPVLGGGWRDEANVIAYDPTQEDVPGKSPGVAAVIVYGQAFGDPNRGSVMYESGHDINENNASGVAAMRAFFNWSFMTMEGKTPDVDPIVSAVAPGNNIAGPVQLSVSASSPIGAALTYKWAAIRKSDSTPVGSFSVNNNAEAASTVFTPPAVVSLTEIVIQVVVTDACGRVAVSADNFNVTNEVGIAGKLWHDSDGNALAGAGEKPVSGHGDNSDSGNSSVTGGDVYANLVNADNQVVQSVQVNPDGTFFFANVPAGQAYEIILTTEPKAPASTLEAADAALPPGWMGTGTNLEGVADAGNRSNVLSLGTLTGEVLNADFGLEQAPVAKDKTSEALLNPGGTTQVPLNAALFEGGDPEDAPDGYAGNLSGREVVLFPATNGTLYYNGVAITTATPVTAFDPAEVSVDPDGTSPWSAVEVTFEFTVKDNAQVVSAPGTITVPFVPVLVAINDINQTPQDVPVNGDVLTNDEGAGLSVTGAVQGTTTIPVGAATTVSGADKNGTPVSNAGSIVLNADGTYTFTPAPGFNGTIDPIVYDIVDAGGGVEDAILDIKVIPATTGGNDGPIAQDDNVKTKINTPITANVLVNDSDPDGDTLTVTGSSVPLGFTVQVPGKDKDGNIVPNAGTLLLKPDGSYTFTPANGFTGTVDPVDYTISDGKGGADAAQLTILVLPAEENTTLANDDANSAPKGKTMTGNVKDNDSDPEENTTVVTAANANGTTIVIGGTPTVIPGAGQLTLRPDGSYTFVPDADFVGTVPVVYQICDNGTPVACDLTTLYLTTLDAVLPDLTPFVTFDPNVISGTRNFTARIRVLNLNSTSGGPTTGAKITVRVPKNAKWTVVWDAAATSNALGTLHNAIWTYSASGIYHTWTATAIIPKGGSRYIGFTGTFTPGMTMGTSPVTVQIDYPSGGETNDVNNTDIESVEYSGF